jgi:hypothetical protein
MTTPTIKPSELEAQAEELSKSGKMPTLDEVLSAVVEAREKYADKIKQARQEDHVGANALKK